MLFSSTRVLFWNMFTAVFPMVVACYGIMYSPSFLLNTAKAQLCAIILAFMMYLFAGADPPFKTYASLRLSRASARHIPDRTRNPLRTPEPLQTHTYVHTHTHTRQTAHRTPEHTAYSGHTA